MKLSPRLKKIIDMIRFPGLLIDIGCDHALVAAQAVDSGISSGAIASDIAEGPLCRASETIRSYGLDNRIVCVRSDGFKNIPVSSVPDTIVISGMGGRLMTRILSGGLDDGFPVGSARQLLLSPQSEPGAVRIFIIERLKFNILRESVVSDEGKYYIIMDVRNEPSGCSYSEAHYLFGRNIDPESLDLYREYLGILSERLKRDISLAAKSSSNGAMSAVRELKHKLFLLEERFKEVS